MSENPICFFNLRVFSLPFTAAEPGLRSRQLPEHGIGLGFHRRERGRRRVGNKVAKAEEDRTLPDADRAAIEGPRRQSEARLGVDRRIPQVGHVGWNEPLAGQLRQILLNRGQEVGLIRIRRVDVRRLTDKHHKHVLGVGTVSAVLSAAGCTAFRARSERGADER